MKSDNLSVYSQQINIQKNTPLNLFAVLYEILENPRSFIQMWGIPSLFCLQFWGLLACNFEKEIFRSYSLCQKKKKIMKVKPICNLHPFHLGNEISFDSDTDIISSQHTTMCGTLCFITCDNPLMFFLYFFSNIISILLHREQFLLYLFALPCSQVSLNALIYE